MTAWDRVMTLSQYQQKDQIICNHSGRVSIVKRTQLLKRSKALLEKEELNNVTHAAGKVS